jgi:hypothetical protein
MPRLFEIKDRAGDIWMSPHLTCGGSPMLPGHNPNTLSPPIWWWYCLSCKRFVRPLSDQEAQVLELSVTSGKPSPKKPRRSRR